MPFKGITCKFDLKGSYGGRRSRSREAAMAQGPHDYHHDATLLDQDYVDEMECGREIALRTEDKRGLMEQLMLDVLFLADHGVMDYSLFVGRYDPAEDDTQAPEDMRASHEVSEEQGRPRSDSATWKPEQKPRRGGPGSQFHKWHCLPHARHEGISYYFGIIDVSQPYELSKHLERQAKYLLQCLKCSPHISKISASPPGYYGRRFLHAMNHYISPYMPEMHQAIEGLDWGRLDKIVDSCGRVWPISTAIMRTTLDLGMEGYGQYHWKVSGHGEADRDLSSVAGRVHRDGLNYAHSTQFNNSVHGASSFTGFDSSAGDGRRTSENLHQPNHKSKRQSEEVMVSAVELKEMVRRRASASSAHKLQRTGRGLVQRHEEEEALHTPRVSEIEEYRRIIDRNAGGFGAPAAPMRPSSEAYKPPPVRSAPADELPASVDDDDDEVDIAAFYAKSKVFGKAFAEATLSGTTPVKNPDLKEPLL